MSYVTSVFCRMLPTGYMTLDIEKMELFTPTSRPSRCQTINIAPLGFAKPPSWFEVQTRNKKKRVSLFYFFFKKWFHSVFTWYLNNEPTKPCPVLNCRHAGGARCGLTGEGDEITLRVIVRRLGTAIQYILVQKQRAENGDPFLGVDFAANVGDGE